MRCGGVKRYGLNYGPLRLWGSAAFVLGALVYGMLFDPSRPKNLIWIIAGSAAIGAVASLALQPLDEARTARPVTGGAGALLRDVAFRCYRGVRADPGQPCRLLHCRVDCLATGRVRRTLTIATLWVLGVIAEIVLFALSSRVHPAAVNAGGDRGAERCARAG